jgi:hypothetical protein
MLASSEEKLRWWGMDMRPRWRRRMAVSGTFFALYVLTMAARSNRWSGHHPYLGLFMMIGSTMICVQLSVFRRSGVVKSFEDPPPTKTGIRGMVFVNGLDEWARYRFDVASFDDASEEQQTELLRRYQVGTRVFPAKPKPWTGLDEREIGERDGASRWALLRIGVLLASYAGTVAVQRQPLSQMEASGFLWGFALLAQTLPQARVLWTERDPREVSGEMELVEGEA